MSLLLLIGLFLPAGVLCVEEIKFPSGPDLGNLVLSRASFSLVFYMAAWDVVSDSKYRCLRLNASRRLSARTQNSLPTQSGGGVMLNAAVNPILRHSGLSKRLLTSTTAGRT